MDEKESQSNRIAEEMQYIERGGGRVPVYIARPDDASPHPAVIVVHEIFGLNDHIQDIARRFASEGIAAYAPCLFSRHPGVPDNRDDLAAMRSLWQAIPDEDLIADLQSVFSLARSSSRVQPNAIGAIGFCMGGAIAYMFACRTPLLAWVINFYGRIFYPEVNAAKPRHPIDYSGGLNCPLFGVFAGMDDLITGDQIRALEDKLVELGKTFSIRVYHDARHAFFNDQRGFYNSEAAKEAWRLSLDFITRHSPAPVLS